MFISSARRLYWFECLSVSLVLEPKSAHYINLGSSTFTLTAYWNFLVSWLERCQATSILTLKRVSFCYKDIYGSLFLGFGTLLKDTKQMIFKKCSSQEPTDNLKTVTHNWIKWNLFGHIEIKRKITFAYKDIIFLKKCNLLSV